VAGRPAQRARADARVGQGRGVPCGRPAGVVSDGGVGRRVSRARGLMSSQAACGGDDGRRGAPTPGGVRSWDRETVVPRRGDGGGEPVQGDARRLHHLQALWYDRWCGYPWLCTTN
jgi:hypothetical protein